MSSSASSRGRRRKKTTSINIRAFDATDLDAVIAVLRAPLVVAGTLQDPHRSREDIEKQLAAVSHARYLVAEVDGEVVAFGDVRPSQLPRRRYVAGVGLVVRDDMQGRGIGGRLFDAELELGERWLGVLRFELEVYVDNKTALSLYRSRGFQIEGVVRGFAMRDGALVDGFKMGRLAENLPWPRVTAEDVAGRMPPQLGSGPDSAGNGNKKRGGRGFGGWN